MKKIILLGCTGSIGRNTIDIIRRYPDEFRITGLSAHRNEKELQSLKTEFGNPVCVLTGQTKESSESGLSGEEQLLRMLWETDADLVVNAIAGSAGLLPSEAAISSGKNLALANKETVVMAGDCMNDLAKKNGRMIIPVDSEHSAVFQLLRQRQKDDIEEIILTASGGPFRNASAEELQGVTPKQALNHPVWNMGRKITLDSATLANKGLEVLEAYYYFHFSLDKIKVLIHPDGLVHSLVRTYDGAMYAQISAPDMRLPILNALTYPRIKESSYGRMNLEGKSFSFSAPDTNRFPMLKYAYQAGKSGGGYPAAYNGANETAADAFFKGLIGFTDIAEVVGVTLEADWGNLIGSCQQARETGVRASEYAASAISRIGRSN